jgi:hypothetical protein
VRALRILLPLVLGALAASPVLAIDSLVKLRPPGRGFQLRLSPFELAGHRERELCQAVRPPVKKPVDVDRIKVKMPFGETFGSHHVAMFLADATAADLPLDPIDSAGCAGIGGALVSPILGFVQRVEGDVIRFPKGVGVTITPEHALLLNPHFVNAGDEPRRLDVAVNFHRAPRGRVKQHARSFQLGTVRIEVPVGEEAITEATWPVPFPMNVVWLSTHSHKHTRTVDLEIVRAGAAERVLQTTSYDHPAVQNYARPFLRLEPGDAIRWTCRYRNDTDTVVRFGVTAEDEMCFAVGFFVPDDDDAPLPDVPGCFGSGLGLVCPLN